MTNVNVKVSMNNAGEIVVVGVNKNGSESKTQYTVVETVGVREFAKEMVAVGIKKQAERSEAPTQAPVKPEPKKEEKVMKKQQPVGALVYTKGNTFTDIKRIGNRAVQFNIVNKGECVIGFAKDRNVFLEAHAGEIKEVTRTEVIRRLCKYQGADVKNLVKAINNLKPVALNADICTVCNCAVSHKVRDYSKRTYGQALCRDCQNDFGKEVAKAEHSEAVNKKSSYTGPAFDTCECGEQKLGGTSLCTQCMDATYAQMMAEWEKEEAALKEGASVVSADALEEELAHAGVVMTSELSGAVVDISAEDLLLLAQN